MTEKKPEFKNVHDVLHYIQKNISVPKSQYNKFGDYYYRDAEDILEAAKKIMPDGALVTITDDVFFLPSEVEFVTHDKTEKTDKQTIQKSAGRVYIKSTATITYKDNKIETCGFSREELSKKGMDASQVTAATSSYARKIALNGLFMIEDNKDSDKTDKTTKKERDEIALMEKTGTDNPEDAKAANALGGSPRFDIDETTTIEMYNQALNSINSAESLDALKKVWSGISKGKKVFTQEQWQDLEQAKDEAKQNIAPF